MDRTCVLLVLAAALLVYEVGFSYAYVSLDTGVGALVHDGGFL